jgi:hypothetical protein
MAAQKPMMDAALESALTLSSHFKGMVSAFRSSCHKQPPSLYHLRISDLTVALYLSGEQMVEATLPALAHLVTDAESAPPAITFHLWDGASTGVLPPRPPFSAEDYRRYGQRAVAHDAPISIMHAPTSGQLFAYDRATRQGYFWVEDASLLSIYERAAPLQSLFHWALAEFGWQTVHAAAVGTDAGGVLLVGGSGAGKSTTALSCLAQEGLHFLSDDKCLVRLEPEPQAFALFSSAKIKADMLERLSHFRPLLAGWDNHVKADKGLVFLHPTYADQMVTTFPIKALLLPQVAHRDEAAIAPAAPGDVFRQLGPSTVIWLPGAEGENYRFTAALTRRLPCYRIELAWDPQVNVDAIINILETL